jgi:hypothetical protein
MNEYLIYLGERFELQPNTILADSPEEAIDNFTDEHPVQIGTKLMAQNVSDPEDCLIWDVGVN